MHGSELRCVERRDLVALENADCTTVRREFDFRQATADGAKKTLGKSRRDMPDAVRIGLQIGFGLIVDRACGGLRLKVKGIAAGEMHLDGAAAALHCIDSG